MQPVLSQRSGHQPRIMRLSEAHNNVEPFLDYVYNPVGEMNIHFNCRITMHEVSQCWHNQHTNQRQADTQFASGGLLRF